MIVSFRAVLERRDGGNAVGAFTCYDLEAAEGILRAAREAGVSVVLLVASSTFSGEGGQRFLAGLRAFAERSPVEACLQLDHVTDLAQIEAAFELGAGAAMADGSRLAFEENVELVRAAAELAARWGATVEAELGALEGNEDEATLAQSGKLTDPDEARRFVERVSCSCLAVSIGNVHGRYARPPQLDWQRLAAIRSAVGVPLSLHGASGLPDVIVRKAIAGGVAKVNVNTELRDAYLAETAATLPGIRDGAALHVLHRAQTAAVASAVAAKLQLFAGR